MSLVATTFVNFENVRGMGNSAKNPGLIKQVFAEKAKGTDLLYAADTGDVETVEKAMKTASAEEKNNVLYHAVMMSQPDIVNLLIERFSLMNRFDRLLETDLDFFSKHNGKTLDQIAEETRAKLDGMNIENKEQLIKRADEVIRLVKLGKARMVMQAVRRGDIPLLRYCFSSGYDVNAVIKEESNWAFGNPLIRACNWGQLEVVKFLVKEDNQMILKTNFPLNFLILLAIQTVIPNHLVIK